MTNDHESWRRPRDRPLTDRVGASVKPSADPNGNVPAAPVPHGEPIDHRSPIVEGAVRDLAARLGIEEREVTVIDARAVTWPDRSCGCPRPGMNYPQVCVDGSFVLLEAAGTRYDYRGGSTIVLCRAER